MFHYQIFYELLLLVTGIMPDKDDDELLTFKSKQLLQELVFTCRLRR
jgi:hypothetical protein